MAPRTCTWPHAHAYVYGPTHVYDATYVYGLCMAPGGAHVYVYVYVWHLVARRRGLVALQRLHLAPFGLLLHKVVQRNVVEFRRAAPRTNDDQPSSEEAGGDVVDGDVGEARDEDAAERLGARQELVLLWKEVGLRLGLLQ